MASQITETTLRMGDGPEMWDNLTLFVKTENGVLTLDLKDRDTALDINRELSIASFNRHKGELTLSIDDEDFTWPETTWNEVLGVTEQWLEDFIALEFS